MTTPTTSDILLENATRYADMPALSSKNNSGNWDTTTWAEFSGETMDVAKSLTATGSLVQNYGSHFSRHGCLGCSHIHMAVQRSAFRIN